MKVKTWYTYCITFDDGSFYYGYRGTCKDPANDFLVKYFSSSDIVIEKMKTVKFSGKILNTFLVQEDAYIAEQSEIKANFNNPLILNRACYFGRKGFGILSDAAKLKIGARSKELWADPTYREKMSSRGSRRWTDEAKLAQSTERTGIKRPDHSKKMKGRTAHPRFIDFITANRTDIHKKNISIALTGKTKTEEHKAALRKPKPLVVTRIHDRKLMALGNFTNWVNYQTRQKSQEPKKLARTVTRIVDRKPMSLSHFMRWNNRQP